MKIRWPIVLFCAFIAEGFASDPHSYLAGKIPQGNCRYETFKDVLELLEQRSAKTLVETGTARYGAQYFDSDGGSTIIFAKWAKDHQAHLFSVDISLGSLENAQAAILQYTPESEKVVSYICSDSIAYLNQIDFPIDFLYLDSYDYELDNPLPSQIHHLREIQAAYPHLTDASIILIDDCDLPGGGKGKEAIAFLLEKGWKIVKNQYQVILLKR